MITKVTLRKKKITGSKLSLYLDFYPPIPHPETGEPTRREFLRLYVPMPIKFKKRKEKNGKEKLIPVYHENPIQNTFIETDIQNILERANQIRKTRENELNKPEIYSHFEREQLKVRERLSGSFLTYFLNLADQHSGKTRKNWFQAHQYLVKYTNGSLKFSDLNLKFCNDFRAYLLRAKSNRFEDRQLNQNTAWAYFSKFKAGLRQAFKDEFLQHELSAKVDAIKRTETQRDFLTIEELNLLAKIDFGNTLLKRAALFSALTGVRASDIEKLIWSEVHDNPEQGSSIRFTQQKTKGVEFLPISGQARTMLGERKEPTDKVFAGFDAAAREWRQLAKWFQLAGIDRKITFHCFRHTFATLQMAAGTDIYTVSKMLGHRELKTTQIYAKIIDRTKREAAEKIQLEF
jgi:integrase